MLAIAAAVGAWLLAHGPHRVVLPRLGRRWVVGPLGGAAVAAVIGLHPLAGAASATGVAAVVDVVRGVVRRRGRALLTTRWPDFLALTRGRIAAGEPLPDAVRVAGRSLGGGFEMLDRPWGGSFGEGLREIQIEWGDPVADRVLTTLRVAVETGGAHVDSVLSSLALSLSDEIRLRRAHEAAIAQQQMTAGVALLAPWLILLLSLTTNPQAATEFSSQAGRLVLAAGGFATLLGYYLARRASQLSAPPRVFG